MRLPVNRSLPLMALILLAACGGGGGSTSDLPPPPRASGPAGDYPMVLGPTYTVEGVSHTPADVMNYDAVGYAGVADGAGVSASHRTLPLPSRQRMRMGLSRARPSDLRPRQDRQRPHHFVGLNYLPCKPRLLPWA